MAIKEQDKVFYEELANGDKVINLPITRANNVEGLGRSANTAYAVGDVVYVDNNKKVALKCTQAGTTSNSELNVGTANIGDSVTDGSVVWQVCNRTSDVTSVNGKTGDVVVDLPVGHMYFSVEPNVPAGRLPAMGATYNRALYADLWAWANSVGLVKSESEWQAIASANGGNCAYYSSGNGSTTFRVPSIKCWVKGANSASEVGSYLQAGLPNITGEININQRNGFEVNETSYTSGALSHVGKMSTWYSNQHRMDMDSGISFDASRSNSIYGNSDTVQPSSLVGQWLIVAFGVAHNIGEADVANVMQAVEQVQTSVGTLEQGVGTAIDYIVESYRNGTEWYEVYKSGKVRQGGVHAQTTSGGAPIRKSITLLKKMANKNYYANAIPYRNDVEAGGYYAFYVTAVGRETQTLEINFSAANGTQFIDGFVWQVEGQGA